MNTPLILFRILDFPSTTRKSWMPVSAGAVESHKPPAVGPLSFKVFPSCDHPNTENHLLCSLKIAFCQKVTKQKREEKIVSVLWIAFISVIYIFVASPCYNDYFFLQWMLLKLLQHYTALSSLISQVQKDVFSVFEREDPLLKLWWIRLFSAVLKLRQPPGLIYLLLPLNL